MSDWVAQSVGCTEYGGLRICGQKDMMYVEHEGQELGVSEGRKSKPLPTLGTSSVTLWCMCLKDFQRGPHPGTTTQHSSSRGSESSSLPPRFSTCVGLDLAVSGLAVLTLLFGPLSQQLGGLYTGKVSVALQ